MLSASGDPLFQEFESLREYLNHTQSLKNCTIQLIDFTDHAIDWTPILVENTVFLGCSFPPGVKGDLLERGAIIFPKVKHLPYDPYRGSLYTWQELMEGYHPENDQSLDLTIYR